jgi:hypothetical protein
VPLESGRESAESAASRFASAPAVTTSAMAAHTRPTCSGSLDGDPASCSGELSYSSSLEAAVVERNLPTGNRRSASAAPHAGGAGGGMPRRDRDLADSRGSAPLGSRPRPASRRRKIAELAVRCGAGSGWGLRGEQGGCGSRGGNGL